MKKVIFILLALLAVCKVPVMADRVSMPSMKIEAGQEFVLSVVLENELPYVAMLMDLVLPEGITFVQDNSVDEGASFAVNYATSEMASSHLLVCRTQANGSLRIAGYSMDNISYSIGSDTLLLVKLKSSKELAAGDYEVRFTNVVFTTADGKDHVFADAVTLLTVPSRYSLNLVAQPARGGVVNGAANYEDGTTATVKAIPSDGYVFTEWTGANGETLSTEANFDYTVLGATTLTAHFAQLIEVHDTVYLSNLQRVEPPTISVNEEELIVMTCPQENATIYYTTDGSEPDENSIRYVEPFNLSKNCSVRAVAIMRSEVVGCQITSVNPTRYSQEVGAYYRQYYDLKGHRSSANHKGILLKTETSANGQNSVKKILNMND